MWLKEATYLPQSEVDQFLENTKSHNGEQFIVFLVIMLKVKLSNPKLLKIYQLFHSAKIH